MPKFPQHLPSYTRNFLNYSQWLVRESEHYVFHYTAGSEAERDIESIVMRQETAFEKILRTLPLSIPSRKINYYLYPDPEMKIELMGDDWFAQAIYNEWCVHVLYTANDKPLGEHEDTHLLTLPWGISISLLQEGLAEYLVGHNWYGAPHAECVAEGSRKGFLLRPGALLTDEEWRSTPDEGAIYFYALAGAWVRYLIETYGMERFIALYKGCTRGDPRETIYALHVQHCGESVDIIEKKFFASLSSMEKAAVLRG